MSVILRLYVISANIDHMIHAHAFPLLMRNYIHAPHI